MVNVGIVEGGLRVSELDESEGSLCCSAVSEVDKVPQWEVVSEWGLLPVVGVTVTIQVSVGIC